MKNELIKATQQNSAMNNIDKIITCEPLWKQRTDITIFQLNS